MAPEVICQTKYGRRADMWSFGCTLLEMATGKAPWHHCNFDNPVNAILQIGLNKDIPLVPTNLSEELQDLIRLCLKRDPEERPYAANLLEHKFLKMPKSTPQPANVLAKDSD